MQIRNLFFLTFLCLALIMPILLPCISVAESESRQVDEAALKELKATKTALDTERAQLVQEFLDIIHRGKTTRMRPAMKRVAADLAEHAERLALFLERENAFEKDWYRYNTWIGDSPEVESFKARNAALDAERTRLLEAYAELVGANDSQTSSKRKMRYYKQDLRAIEEQFLAYRDKREAFEKDWGAFYAAQLSAK